jgi:Holliday junction resolvase RusA-like endonuclease
VNAQVSLDLPGDRLISTRTSVQVYRFVVYGSPAPQGSKSAMRWRSKDGREGINLIESSKKVKPWRQDVKAAALMARNGGPTIDGPIIVRMVFTMPKPASAPKNKRTFPMRMPDLSKLARSTEDALTEAAMWADDARVIEYERLAKVYPNEDPDALDAPGVRIEIRQAAP